MDRGAPARRGGAAAARAGGDRGHPRSRPRPSAAARELVEAAPFRESGPPAADGGSGGRRERRRGAARVRGAAGAAARGARRRAGAGGPGAPRRAAHRAGRVPEALRDERKLVTVVCAEPAGTLADPEDLRAGACAAARGVRAVRRASTIRRWPCSACPPRTRTTRSAPCARRCRPASSAWRRAPGSPPARRSSPAAPPPARSRPPPSGCSGRPRAGATLADEATVHATRGALDFEASDAGWSARATRAAARPAPRPLVGRAYELAALESLYARVVAERRPHLVTVVGHAGIGKSRLVDEFARRPSRPLPALRRGHHVLGAAGDPRERGRDPARRQRGATRRPSCGRWSRQLVGRRGRARDGRRWPPAPASSLPGPEREEPSPESVAEEIALAWPRLLSALAPARRRDRGPALGRAAAARPGRGDRRPLRRPAAAGRHRAPGAGRSAAGLGLPAGNVAGRASAAERHGDAAARRRAAPGARRGAAASRSRARRRATRSSPRSSRGTSSPMSRARSPPPCGRCSPPASTRCRRSNGACCGTPRSSAARSGRPRWRPTSSSARRCGRSKRAGSSSPRATSALPGHTRARVRARAHARGRLPLDPARRPLPHARRRRALDRGAASAIGARSSSSCSPTTTRRRLARPTPRWRGPTSSPSARPRGRGSARAGRRRRCRPPADGDRPGRSGSPTARWRCAAPTPSGSPALELQGPQLPRRGARRRCARRLHRGDRARRRGSATRGRGTRMRSLAILLCTRYARRVRQHRAGVDAATALVQEGLAVDGDEPAELRRRRAARRPLRGARGAGRRRGSSQDRRRGHRRDAERAVEIAEEIGSSLLLADGARGPDVAVLRRGSLRRCARSASATCTPPPSSPTASRRTRA